MITLDEQDFHGAGPPDPSAEAGRRQVLSADPGPDLNPTAHPGPDRRAVLAGVDEAGLGPILGPLVVAGVAMEGPRGMDPWTALGSVVCRNAPRRRAREGREPLFVADSKKVKQGPHGTARLERVVLAAWAAFRGAAPPRTLAEWLDQLGVDRAALARARPWYRDLDLPLPWASTGLRAGDVALDGHLLRRELERVGMRFLDVAAHPTDVVEFNRSIAETDNKSRTHFVAYARVLDRLLDAMPDRAHLVADRCGGLTRYRSPMARSWPDRRVHRLEEGAARSSYRVGRRGGRVEDGWIRLTFQKEAEEAAFPTALASCVAKYLRECLMQRINAWFAARRPDLAPTAGYYTDGLRFLADVEPVLLAERIDRAALVRAR